MYFMWLLRNVPLTLLDSLGRGCAKAMQSKDKKMICQNVKVTPCDFSPHAPMRIYHAVEKCHNNLWGHCILSSFALTEKHQGVFRNISALAIASAMLLCSCRAGYEIASVEGRSVAMDSSFDFPAASAVTTMVEAYKEQISAEMSPVIGYSSALMERSASRDYNILANTLSDLLVGEASRFAAIDFAVLNVGGLRSDVPAGALTVGTAFEVLPFMNTLCIAELGGDAVMELFTQIAQRGGAGLSSEVRLEITPDGKLLGAWLAGEEIDKHKVYTIATIDYLAEGNGGMEAFRKSKTLFYSAGTLFRDIFINHVRQLHAAGKPLEPKTDRRIIVK